MKYDCNHDCDALYEAHTNGKREVIEKLAKILLEGQETYLGRKETISKLKRLIYEETKNGTSVSN